MTEGLSTAEARQRLERFGENAMAEARTNPHRTFLLNFGVPFPG